jgi:hypothetical protein
LLSPFGTGQLCQGGRGQSINTSATKICQT